MRGMPGHVGHGDVVPIGCPLVPVGGRLDVGVAGARRADPALALEELEFRQVVLVADQSHVE